jgi:hypothetical protein
MEKGYSEVVLEKMDIHTHKNETSSYLSPCKKINSKCFKDLYANDFLEKISKVQIIKAQTNGFIAN